LVRDLDPGNDLTFLRITCKKYEMMIAPDKEFFLIVIQKPEDEA
jgi:dynein light chain roadblock-type